MTEEEFTKRLTQYEKDRLRTCAAEASMCAAKNAFSFMAYWTKQIQDVIKDARERMAREEAK